MTFTAIARCQNSGKLGIITATRPPGVGGRVPHIAPNSGAVAIMAIADRRLGDTALKLLDLGYKAPGVIDALVLADPYCEYRQLGVIDDDGFAAAHLSRRLATRRVVLEDVLMKVVDEVPAEDVMHRR